MAVCSGLSKAQVFSLRMHLAASAATAKQTPGWSGASHSCQKDAMVATVFGSTSGLHASAT